MNHSVRSTLFGLFVLAVAACQSTSPNRATPVGAGGGDATPSGLALASIEGAVWHDLCDSGADGEPALTQTPPGCVQVDTALGRFHADGSRQASEPGLPGVTLSLAAGACPGGDVLQTALSDANGAFTFSGLEARPYCVAIDSVSADNQAALLPGVWTHPQAEANLASLDVTLRAGEAMTGVDFGWDEQSSPRHVRAATYFSQSQLQVFDTGIDLDTQALPTSGLMPRGGVAQGQVFAFVYSPTAQVVTRDGSQSQVAFIQKPDLGLAVWPGLGDQTRLLAWSNVTQDNPAESVLLVSDLSGTAIRSVYSEPLDANRLTHLVVQGWAADGTALLFSREPYGIGGYIPFDGASSLYRLQLDNGQVTTLVDYDPQARHALCLDSLSPDGDAITSHCPPTEISLLDLSGNVQGTIATPSSVGQPFLLGSALFSPDGGQVAFAIARGNPDDEHGWVAVSDGLSGASHVITDRAGGYFHVAAWLNNGSLLLQWIESSCGSDCAGDSLWTIGADGSGLTQVAEGDFIAITNAGQP